jgi:hypothetical protein
MNIFAYLRDGDRTDANKIRVMADSPLLLVLLGEETPSVVPEGKTVAEHRAEQETAGVEFRYRLISFSDWMKDNSSELLEKWQGFHKDSIYPVAAPGTFWNEYNPAGDAQDWDIKLLSLETGEPVDTDADYVAEVKKAILEKNLTAEGKINVTSRYEKPAEVVQEGAEATDTAADTTEGAEAAPSEAGEATGDTGADQAAA